MISSLIDFLAQPEDYVCVWRDGEIYIEPAADFSNTDTDDSQETSKETDVPIAA